MAAPTYGTDLTTIDLAESTTGWAALGGGGAGLSASPDIAIQGTNCVDKQITSAEKGQVFDNGSAITFGANDHAYIWISCTTPGLIDTYINRGLVAVLGASTSAYVKFHLTGVAEFRLNQAFKCWPIRPVTTSSTSRPRRTLVGSPANARQVFGAMMNTTASVKGANLGVDGIRKGTGFYITAGDSGTPATFAGAAAIDLTSRYGITQAQGGGNFDQQGRLVVGQNTSGTPTLAYFVDANGAVNFTDTEHSLTDFSQVIVDHASTVFNLTNFTFKGLGTNNKGRLIYNNASTVSALTGCNFLGTDITTLRAGVTALRCQWIGSGQVSANSASMVSCSISGFEGTANTSALIWNTAVDPDGKLDNMNFTKGTAATHAIEFGLTSPLTMTLSGVNFSGYNASNAQNDSAVHVKRTTGTVTINVVGGSGTVSYRTDGATVVIVANPVTTQVTVRNIDTNVVIENARVYVKAADNAGPYPWDETVTITRSGSTASVAHTAHGMSNSDQVYITGANQKEYNGVFVISNVTANAYDYTVTGTPTTPATGTIKATWVLFEGDLTNASGIVTDSRTFSASQNVTGRARFTSAPYYKEGKFTGTISNVTGLSTTVLMVPDV